MPKPSEREPSEREPSEREPSEQESHGQETGGREPGVYEYQLRLYIIGGSVNSQRAVQRIKSICEQQLRDRYLLEIVDIMEDPAAAQEARIIATPTLIKSSPLPIRRIIGDMSNREQVLVGLDAVPDSWPDTA